MPYNLISYSWIVQIIQQNTFYFNIPNIAFWWDLTFNQPVNNFWLKTNISIECVTKYLSMSGYNFTHFVIRNLYSLQCHSTTFNTKVMLCVLVWKLSIWPNFCFFLSAQCRVENIEKLFMENVCKINGCWHWNYVEIKFIAAMPLLYLPIITIRKHVNFKILIGRFSSTYINLFHMRHCGFAKGFS